ncbi:hypothetical protein [Rhodococcus sp. X156]|uniref:hypothetical protein n=1 Tax=Rhodococcus sp. X156 TaxID=2499145 RepID=UPI000FD75FF3|nr:hypothetical protein [Rhodococcus sp. X156]
MRAHRTSLLGLLCTVAASASLIGGALFTVAQAGCDTPAHLQTRADGGVELVGGCVAAGDLVVPGAPTTPAAVPDGQGNRP